MEDFLQETEYRYRLALFVERIEINLNCCILFCYFFRNSLCFCFVNWFEETNVRSSNRWQVIKLTSNLMQVNCLMSAFMQFSFQAKKNYQMMETFSNDTNYIHAEYIKEI